MAWHGEVAEQNPPLYAVIDAAGLSHSKGMKSYLIMMAVRLIEMERILEPTGSIDLHCDDTASHYLKQLMDVVFGKANYRNEIVWQRNNGSAKGSQHEAKKWGQNTDSLLYYVLDSKTPVRALSGDDAGRTA